MDLDFKFKLGPLVCYGVIVTGLLVLSGLVIGLVWLFNYYGIIVGSACIIIGSFGEN